MGRGFFHTITDAIGEARRAMSAYDRLDRLGDAELARRGLARGDIIGAAFRSAQRHR